MAITRQANARKILKSLGLPLLTAPYSTVRGDSRLDLVWMVLRLDSREGYGSADGVATMRRTAVKLFDVEECTLESMRYQIVVRDKSGQEADNIQTPTQREAREELERRGYKIQEPA